MIASGFNKRRSVSGLVLSLMIVGGCGGGARVPEDAKSPAPIATVAPASPDAEGVPGSCGSVTVSYDYAPADIRTLVARGRDLLAVTVLGTETASFNTADGRAPTDLTARDVRTRTTVYTPVVVQVDEDISGTGKLGERRVLVEGGDVGCYRVVVAGGPILEKGASYVLVVAPTIDFEGKDLGLQRILFAWPIDASGMVGTSEGDRTMTQVGDEVAGADASAP